MFLNIILEKSFLICIIYPSPLTFWVYHEICKKKLGGEDSIAFIYNYLVNFLKFFYVL
jgi:hypothetical protein